jgi:hypothetical protein
LLTPVGTPFEWNYGQHAPMITPVGTLLVYDDGNFRASPFDAYLDDDQNYSRAVEYSINEQTMEVSQVWDYGRDNVQRIFTDRVGNADWLPKTTNVLVTFGNVDYVDGLAPNQAAPFAEMLRIQEVTHEASPQVVFDLAAFDFTTTDPNYHGTFAYRSHRIPDLYPHPLLAVSDLTVQMQASGPLLLFSGDSTLSYVIQSSPDLLQWTDLASPDYDGAGSFSFTDATASVTPARFYRVATRQ